MSASDAEVDAGKQAALLFARPWNFVRGAPALDFLPPQGPPEIAFTGRSNVGKSSLINALTGQNGLARTSNTPGRTQELNFFVPQGHAGTADDLPAMAIVDLPGYGFAKAPKSKVDAWTALVFDYLRGRASLRRVFALIDARHGLKPNDVEVLDMLDRAAVSYQIVLTKTDKLKPGELARRMAETAQAVGKRPAAHPLVLATSAQKAAGIAELRVAVARAAAE